MALVCTLLALAPFAAWTGATGRSFMSFSRWRRATPTIRASKSYPGWQRWVKTWCLDFVSTYEVYWPVPGSPLDLSELPSRAFDSPAQYAETAALAPSTTIETTARDILPDVDARFAKLPDERIAAHPLRYYLWLPLGRVADMWLRPRVENLNIDLDWWVYAHHHAETRFSWAYAGLNAFYLVLGAGGLWLRPRFWKADAGLHAAAQRSAADRGSSRDALHPECFPMLFALGGVALYWMANWVCCRFQS